MHALIVCAIDQPGTAELVEREAMDCDLRIAADRGAATLLKAGITPDLLVGDNDSIPDHALESLRMAHVPEMISSTHKDVTDLDLAIDAARQAGADRVTVIGATGGRLDHTLAAVGTLMGSADMRPHLVDPGLEAWVVEPGHGRFDLRCEGRTVSVLALSPSARVRSSSLRWPLDGLELSLLSSRGVSNVVDAPGGWLEVVDGIVLVAFCADDSSVHT